MDFYKKELLDHFKNPRNYGTLESPNIFSEKLNPSCGDIIEIQIKIKNNIIENIAFTGKGCIISLATASMFIENCKNKSLQQILDLKENCIFELIKLDLGPIRANCALLVLNALQSGILKYNCTKRG